MTGMAFNITVTLEHNSYGVCTAIVKTQCIPSDMCMVLYIVTASLE